MPRGSIPEALLRPHTGESPRYPIDTVIGPLGRGAASEDSYAFAREIAGGLLSGNVTFPQLESYLYLLDEITPVGFRLGEGREEADGAVSFLIRFIGREMGITGELFVRYVTRQIIEEPLEALNGYDDGDDEEPQPVIRTVGNWTLDDLVLEEARTREEERREATRRFDFLPYERFF